MARLAGLEPATLGLEGRCSIQMSYGRSDLKLFPLPERPNIRSPVINIWLIFQIVDALKAGDIAFNVFAPTILITGRGGEIRTPDPLLPKQLRYQAALHPEICLSVPNSAR